MPWEVAFGMVLEAVAARYGKSPAKVLKMPYWTLDHVHQMALIEREMDRANLSQQAAVEEEY